jgi:ABC-type transport system involved in multi-copper enzyme maturation permease subunit
MKKKDKISFWFYHEKILFIHHFKKEFLSIKTLLCISLSIILVIYSLVGIESFDQNILDTNIFWLGFIGAGYSSPFFKFIPIIIAANLISGEFSSKTAMILYSTVSRNRILISKIIFSIIHLLFIIIFSFLLFEIVVLLTMNLTVSIDILLAGFFLIFIELIFWLALTLIFSALARNALAALGFSYFYMSISPTFEYYHMKFLNYNYFRKNIYFFFYETLFNQNSNYEMLILSFTIVICMPIIIVLVTFYQFNKLDIRIN